MDTYPHGVSMSRARVAGLGYYPDVAAGLAPEPGWASYAKRFVSYRQQIIDEHMGNLGLPPTHDAALAWVLGRTRTNYDGSPYTNPGINTEDGDDEAWFYEQASLNADGSNPDEQQREGVSHEEALGLARPMKRL